MDNALTWEQEFLDSVARPLGLLIHPDQDNYNVPLANAIIEWDNCRVSPISANIIINAIIMSTDPGCAHLAHQWSIFKDAKFECV